MERKQNFSSGINRAGSLSTMDGLSALFYGSQKYQDTNEKAATRKGSGMDYLAIFSSRICEVLSLVTASRAVTLALISSTSSAT